VKESLPCRICGHEHPRGLGGHDVAAIFGLKPKENALDVYHRHTRPIEAIEEEADSDDVNIDFFRGHFLEPDIRRWYFDKTGRQGRAWPGGYAQNPEFPAFIVHPDGEIFADAEREAPKEGGGVFEAKAPRARVLRKIIETGLRESEIAQVTTYCGVTRRKWVGFGFGTVEHDAGPIIPVDVVPDPKLVEYTMREGQRFWDEHVLKRIPPDPTEWAIWNNPDAPPMLELDRDLHTIEDEDVIEVARRHFALKLAFKAAEEAHKEGSDELYGLLKKRYPNLAKLYIPDVGKMTRVQRDGATSFDKGALALHRPIDRDALWRMIREEGVDALRDAVTDEALDEVFARIELNLDLFNRVGPPYEYLLTTAAKSKP